MNNIFWKFSVFIVSASLLLFFYFINTNIKNKNDSVLFITSSIGTFRDKSIADNGDNFTNNRIKCPFLGMDNGIVIDLLNDDYPFIESYVSLNKEVDNEKKYFNVNIKKGVYDLYLASYRKYDSNRKYYNEQWFLTFFNKNKEEIFRSFSTRDIKDDEETVEEMVNKNINLNDDVFFVVAEHDLSSSDFGDVLPVCAFLKFVDE